MLMSGRPASRLVSAKFMLGPILTTVSVCMRPTTKVKADELPERASAVGPLPSRR